MGERGTKRKPTNLKLLEGNPGKRHIDINEVKPIPKVGSCPDWLSDSSKDIWNEYSEKLERLGLLSEIDIQDFQNFCIASGDVKDLTIFLINNNFTFIAPSGLITRRPEADLRNQAIKMVTTITSKFGMSPSDRVGLVSGKAEENNSKMGRLLSK
jgi:P27 family predicted phage terminase small subunit